jgi:AcrR family transcriptional regulator
MGRPPGRRSDDYDDKRAALAHQVYLALLEDPQISLTRMAECAGVTRPTLVHYFGDRNGAARAALESAALVGRRFLGLIVSLPIHDPQQVLEQVLLLTIVGWRDRGVGRLHEVGIQLGLNDAETAHCYLSEILDPLTESMQHLLDRMVVAGSIAHPDTHTAAVQLLGPVVLALLHQHGLGGRSVSPLSEEDLAREHVRAFMRAYAT